MPDPSSEHFKKLLFLDAKADQPFSEIVSSKLAELLPVDIIKVSSSKVIEGICSLDIRGIEFSEKGEKKSEHTLITLILLEELDETTLESAYEIAISLHKSKEKPSYSTKIGSDLGGLSVFILARSAVLSIHDTGVALVRLNKDNQSELWPDVIGVCDKGLLSYTAFIPGREKTGDFFLPRGDMFGRAAPSVSVLLTARASKDGVFAKVSSLISARCGISLRDPRIPNYELLAPNFPSNGLSFATYQFDLKGQLKPQIFKQSLASKMPGNKFLIESNGKILGSIRFHLWQDGSVISMDGKFPLEPFLVFLREVIPTLKPDQLQLFRNGETQLTYVLPVTSKDFLQALKIFVQRSGNITIRPDEEKFLIRKVSDEGLSSQFVSRLKFGVLAMREAVFFKKEEKDRFDRQYDDVYNGLQSVREARDEISKAWLAHKRKFESGEIISQDRNTVSISENIDRTIRREMENFWNASVRLIKQVTQVFLREHGVETGFLFKKESTFQNQINDLRQTNAPLANYIRETRKWTQPLIFLRNDRLEHGQPIRLMVDYDINSDPPRIVEPMISGKPLSEYIEFIFDRCCAYVEEMTINCIKQKLPSSLMITEVPKDRRDEVAAVRFALSLSTGDTPEWTILYAETAFDDR